MLTGLIGINGAGKTTRLKYLYETNVQTAAFLPDSPVIPIEVTAWDLLFHVGKLHGLEHDTAKSRAQVLVDTLLIDGGHDRPIGVYSAGNYKKTALATLLVQPPKTLYLDEPLETVDAISRHQVMTILRQLADNGTEILISTQDLHIAMQCDEVQVFSKLNVVAAGTPAEILGEDPFQQLLKYSSFTLNPVQLDWIDTCSG